MRYRLDTALTGVAVCATIGLLLLPQARDAGAVLVAQDDPVALADAQVSAAMRTDPGVLARNIEEALAAKDADLANSFVELAAARQVPLSADLTKRVADAVTEQNSASNFAAKFASGFVTGQADDIGSMSGTVAGDLFVYGDIRDVVREGKHLAMGEDADHLILGLAAAGLAVTAATYATVGGATPVRAGLSLVKDARKVGRLGEGLTAWVGRSARTIVDTPALTGALADASMLRPGKTITAVKAAFRGDKAGDLVKLAQDAGRVGEKAGVRGAMDTLRIAQGPKDVARIAKLAEKNGGQTRAILKMFGRGAILLAVGAFNMTMWVFWALLTLFGFVCSIKAATERVTWSWLQRSRARKARRVLQSRHEMALRPTLAAASLHG
ncbi:hypothetical protein FNL55_18295 [Tardiphaga sp. vice352]|uniref:hypothetical protein n=1 Tax=unclassified Tardiphaga TaxID=2631404 RepID=UPI00116230D3|nr:MULTISPECIES: hypothetical protein [unclassified Tardiphaga]MBC7586447.1 hypothetical protein [Tardiphaga sp.]QDM17729.1 hypothetical protein FNL53_18585 [Tardiphaga sp. vice278]QDM22789.1 hypothetical protein FIU28_17735 [Tardiphaga sp. vice154]QDM33090.1 hypothetical protein FNL55_18295 [Tardiphaga sp. vice352]